MALCMRDIDARKALPKVIFRRLKHYRGQHFCFHGLRSGNPGHHRGSEGRYRRFRPDTGDVGALKYVVALSSRWSGCG